jgi:cytochrome bd-type quinol oxidase subunit 2
LHCFHQNFLASTVLVLAAISAILTLIALWRYEFRRAQIAVILQTVCLLWAVAIAQFPNLGGPDQMPIGSNVAPSNVVRSLLWIAGLGLVTLVPAMLFMLRTFRAGTPKSY